RLYKTYSIHRAGCRTGKERCVHAAQGRAFSTDYVHLVNLKKMKKLYPSGQAMPTRTGPSEPKQSSHDTSHERMTTSLRSLLRAKSISPFYSYRRRAMVSSMSATSILYDVLKSVDWLAIFSPWAIINRSKMYAMTTKQNTCATRTPATNVALQNFEKTHEDAGPVVSNRACELSEGNIFSGECYGGVSNFSGLHELTPFGFGSFFGVKKERPVAASDGKPMRGGNKGLSVISEDVNRLQRLKTFHKTLPSILFLLSTIFVLLNFCFISATHAQSQTHHSGGGAAEVVKPLQIGLEVPEQFWTYNSLFFFESDTIRQDLQDYKGKHLILAFWSLDCGACLMNLPNIQKLQKEFENRIAIIPVNNQTRRNDYERFYEFFTKGHRLLPQKFSGPSIVYDTFYDRLFPYRVLPRYIWIGPNGLVKAILSSEFLNSYQLQLVLDKEVQI